MNELILHHYANSPFSEKVRLVLGMKGMSWRSVTVPVMMPKPDVLALTGGYRRTPFMQIGADIYCDSALMCRVIDRLAPQPPLFPDSCGGMAPVLAQWADSALFWVAVPLTLQLAGPTGILPQATPDFLKAFAADRAAMTAGVRRPGPHDARAQLTNYLGWLEKQLNDGRAFMLGQESCIADVSIAQSLWFMKLASTVAEELLQPWPQLRAWYARVAAFGHGTSTELSSGDALQVARQVAVHAPCTMDSTLGFAAGSEVTVNALDYAADPVAGRLVGLSMEEVVLQRHDERAGVVHVHFPRIGFQIKAQPS
jgi:glutathione S-transferase